MKTDTGYAWVILASSSILHFFSGVTFTTFGIYLVEFVNLYNVRKFYVGILGGIQMGLPLTGPLISPFAQKYGCRRLCCVGGVFVTSGYILSSCVTNFELLIPSFGCLIGLGYTIILLVSCVASQQWFHERRCLASGVSRTGFAVAFFIWPPLVRYLIDEYSCRGSLLIIGGLMLHIVACGTLLRPFPTKHSLTTSKVQLPDSNLNCLSNTDTNAKRLISKFYKYTGCSKKTVGFDILLSLGCVFALCGQFGVLSMVPLRAESLQTSKTSAAMLYVIFGAMSGPPRIVFGYLGDVSCINRIVLVSIGTLLAGACTIFSKYMHSFIEQCIFISIFGLTSAMHQANWPAVFVEVFGSQRMEFAIGVMICCSATASIVSLPLAGWLVDITGDVNTSFIVLGISMVTAAVFTISVYFLKKMQTRFYNKN